MTAPLLRDARPTDAGKLGAMISEAVEARTWKPRLHSAAEDIAHCGEMIDRGWVRVAERDGQLGGFLARDGAEITALFIAGWAQGRGLGSALLKEAMARMDRLSLWTFQANTGACRFYARHGFSETARTDGRDNDEKLPDVHFAWVRDRMGDQVGDWAGAATTACDTEGELA